MLNSDAERRNKELINDFLRRRNTETPTTQSDVTVQPSKETKTLAKTTETPTPATEPMAEKAYQLEPLKLPVIGGKMGGIDYFVTTMQVKDVCERLHFAEEEYEEDTPVEERYQRKLNRSRVKAAMVPYLNGDGHFFPPLVACLDDKAFEQHHDDGKVTHITLSPEAICPIADGQHRKLAFDMALSDGNEELAQEYVGVVFVTGMDTADKQQLFSDLNRNAKLPPKAIGILFDHRDNLAVISRMVADAGALHGRVNLEGNVLSKKSGNQFITLSVIYEVVKSFVLVDPNAKKGKEITKPQWATKSPEDIAAHISDVMENTILLNLPAWDVLRDSKSHELPTEIRKQYICYSSLGWQAIGRGVAVALDMGVEQVDIGRRLKQLNFAMTHKQWAPCLDGKGGVLSRTGNRQIANGIVMASLGGQTEQAAAAS